MKTTTAKVSDPTINTKQFTDFQVLQKKYHRNGVSGLPFYALWVKWTEGGWERDLYPNGMRTCEAVVTVAIHDMEAARDKRLVDPATRVLMLDEMGGVDLEDTMRGDFFHNALVTWLLKHEGE